MLALNRFTARRLVAGSDEVAHTPLLADLHALV